MRKTRIMRIMRIMRIELPVGFLCVFDAYFMRISWVLCVNFPRLRILRIMRIMRKKRIMRIMRIELPVCF